MTDRWRYACPECGSRQVARTARADYCHYRQCPEERIVAVDLKRDRVTATE